MDERRKQLLGLIDEASTVIERRPQRGQDHDPEVHESEAPTLGLAKSDVEKQKAALRDSAADILLRATDALPAIEIPPHADRILEKSYSDLRRESPDENTAPRIGEYALVARFPSSHAADVFLGYKVSNFGFIRRAVVKWTDRHRYDYEVVRQKLLDEARAISFVDHPNIVTILDLNEDELGTYVALEYVAGTDLRRTLVDLSSRKDRIPLEHALYLTSEILRGLHHVHIANGPDGQPLKIIHRDVNPSNILISADGHVKLTDFGAVLMDGRFQDATAPGTIKGKVRYLAPEYITNQVCTLQVDIYGVGIMLFELLTGHPCFMSKDEASAMYKIVTEGVPLDELRQLGVPPAIQSIVERATMREPTKRYQSAIEMCYAIEDFMTSAGIFVSPTKMSSYFQAHGLLG
jgi:eukaryotic-like serine/threonine-protein kinase